MDTSNVKIKVLPKPMEQDEMEDFVKKAAERQKKILQDKYNKFKGGSN